MKPLQIVTLLPEDLKFTKRSSALKRGEIKGVILSVTLRKEYGEAEQLKALAEKNHENRIIFLQQGNIIHQISTSKTMC